MKASADNTAKQISRSSPNRSAPRKKTASKSVKRTKAAASIRLELHTLLFPEVSLRREVDSDGLAHPVKRQGFEFEGELKFSVRPMCDKDDGNVAFALLKLEFKGHERESGVLACVGSIHAQGSFVELGAERPRSEFAQLVQDDQTLHQMMASQLYAFAMRQFNELLVDAGMSDARPPLTFPDELTFATP